MNPGRNAPGAGESANVAAQVMQGAAILARGGLVAFPTETVYGLGADADNAGAVAAIFAAKGRPADHPLIVHVAGLQAVPAWAREIPASAHALLRRFWPGPLTVILPRAARAHDLLTGGQDTVGLRCPDHPLAQSLLREFARRRADPSAGIAAPSANRFGRISPTRARHVHEDLGEAVELVLDGGECRFGIESTIVQCHPDEIRILRPGSIGAAEIAAACGLPVARPQSDTEGPRTSGRLEGHYAPRHPLELVAQSDLANRIEALRGDSIAVLLPQGAASGALPPGVKRFPAPYESAEAFAHVLYECLRQMDASGASRLLVVEPPRDEPWAAVHDRLGRACAGSRSILA